MDTRKVLGIIFSILFVGAFTFVLCWGIINFNKVKDSMSSTGVYTEQDVNNAYQDGYDTALQDKQSYDELINSYRDTITTQTDQISQLSSQVTSITNTNRDYANQITNLENQKSSLESQVENLTTIKIENATAISELNVQVVNLQNEISRLENSGYNNVQELAQKNAQITSLQNTITQLQKTNELNTQTINNLNNQITSLNSQISEMTLQIQNNSSNVSTLNGKIAELEKSVAYYEQYIANLENGEQVVATFEFNGSVYNIQIVNPNSLLSVTNPTSTEYVIFNYWTVNGVEIDLSTYKISQNTKIVADVTYRYKTEFIVNDEVYNSQIVTLNNFATLPTNPSVSGYDFDGWTLNGVDLIDPATIEITEDTRFIAKFTKLHTVTFVYEDSIQDTQIVRNGNFASNVSIEDTTYKNFEGWMLNGTIVNVDNYKIVADTMFKANIVYSYDVEYVVDNEVVNSQIIVNGYYSIVPDITPKKSGYEFIGWSLNGVDVIDASSIEIFSNTQFIAVWIERVGFDFDVVAKDFEGTGFDSTVFDFPIEYQNYVIYYDGYRLYFVDKFTGTHETVDFMSVEHLYLYKDALYGDRSTYGDLWKFDIATRTQTKIYDAKEDGGFTYKSGNSTYGAKSIIHNDIVYVFGNISTYTMVFRTYNLKTQVWSEQTTIKGSFHNQDSFMIIGNYVYFESYYSSTTYINVVNISTNEWQYLQLGASSGVREYKGVPYILDNGVLYRYNPTTNTLGEPLDTLWTSFYRSFVINNVIYGFNNTDKTLGVLDFENNTIKYYDTPFTMIYHMCHVEENKFFVIGTSSNGMSYTYFWEEV